MIALHFIVSCSTRFDLGHDLIWFFCQWFGKRCVNNLHVVL